MKLNHIIAALLMMLLVMNAQANPLMGDCRLNETNITAGAIVLFNSSTTNGSITQLNRYWITLNDVTSTAVAAGAYPATESLLALNTTGLGGTWSINCWVNDTAGLVNSSVGATLYVTEKLGTLTAWDINFVYMLFIGALFFTYFAFTRREAFIPFIASMFWGILGYAVQKIRYFGWGQYNVLSYIYYGEEWQILMPLFGGISLILVLFALFKVFTDVKEGADEFERGVRGRGRGNNFT